MNNQRKYDREFKLNAVKLYQEGGKSLAELSLDLGIPMTTLATWVKQFKANGEESFPGSGSLMPCNEELFRLRRELADTKQERDILKKSSGHLFTSKGMKFEFMRDHSKKFCIEKMAKVLDVCRSGYYEFLKRKTGKRVMENQRLIGKIKEIHTKNRGVYGSPRIHGELKNQGEKCSRKRVARLMRKEQIQAKMRKKWKITTRPNKAAVMAPNYLDQNFIAEAPDKIWVSDITYVATQEGWVYVAVVMDLFSRKIVGLSMGDSLQTDLVIKALKQALHHRNIKDNLMHHSDRGCQYTSNEFKALAIRHGIKLSMSAKGRCYDNAVAESFFHTLKTEHVYFCNYRIREEAKNSIFEYIEVFYNRKRLHSTIGYLSPVDFENYWNKGMQNVV